MKEIPGYAGLYAVDECGAVWSLLHTSSRRKGQIKPYTNTGGYQRVNLYDNAGNVKKHYVHRLVAQTYLPNPLKLPAVNHINANKRDNSIGNLEWCDAKYNIAESRKLGLQRDYQVTALNFITGELREYSSLKQAAIDLSGKPWAFRYPYARHGAVFYYGLWRLEVMPV